MKGRNMETTEVVKSGAKANVPAVAGDMDWGYDNEVSASNVIIPKLLLMQKTSKLVDDDSIEVGVGDIVRSTSKEVLASKGDGVEIIPLHTYDTWVNYDVSDGSPKFVGIEPCTLQNEGLEWDYEVDGKAFRRDKTINVYGLVKSDVVEHVEAKEKGGSTLLFPVLVCFSRTSHRAGKVIASHFFMCKNARQPAPATVFRLHSDRRSNDQNSWYAWEVARSGATEEILLGECRQWYNILKDSLHTQKVDHSDLEEESAPVEKVDTNTTQF
jgi:hypothetical protein